MKKLIYIALPALVLAGCSKNISRLLVDEKHPSSVPANAVFTQAQFNLASFTSSSNVNLNNFRLIDQYWDETTYTDESNYDLGTRLIPDGWWDSWYGNVIGNFENCRRVLKADSLADAAVIKNEIAIVDIQEVIAYYNLVNTFGNVPYSAASNTDNPFPVYDDAKTIYLDLMNRLDTAIGDLDPDAASWGDADQVSGYSGDPAKWKTFAYTLKLKLAILLTDSDPATAKTIVEAVAPNVFKSNADNALYKFDFNPPYTNPIWVDLVQSGRKDFVGDQTIIQLMQSLDDPRIPAYFTVDADGAYSGGVAGKGNSFSAFSKPSENITVQNYPGDLLDYSETEFYLAEAAARGFTVGGTAASHYEAAITASIEFWGGSSADATAYLAQPGVAYATAAGDFREKIARQEYIAFYNRGFDGWVNIRKFDYPKLPAPVNSVSDFPVRFIYPTKEQNVNDPNRVAAAAAIGGDEVTTKLFWDVK